LNAALKKLKLTEVWNRGTEVVRIKDGGEGMKARDKESSLGYGQSEFTTFW
jgi:hypothetical protein